MADTITKVHRSWNMSRIKSKDTKPEIIVRSMLHRMGYRFRVNKKDLPGKPDIVLPKYKTVIFVHGCFWHMHRGCKDATVPKTRTKWWLNKLEGNVKRDKENIMLLRKSGWKTAVIWECELISNKNDKIIRKLKKIINR